MRIPKDSSNHYSNICMRNNPVNDNRAPLEAIFINAHAFVGASIYNVRDVLVCTECDVIY